MANITLSVETREGIGTQAVKKMRVQNKIPGIFYIHGSENIPFIVDRAALHSIWGREAGLIDVTFDGKENKKCIIRDIQFDPVKGKPIHIDLLGIKMTEKIKVSVHIQLVGTAEGVKTHGGVLQQIMREVEVECMPSDIPDTIEVDVTELGIGDGIHLSDIEIENVIFQLDSSAVVATVGAPRVIEEETTEEDEELEEGSEEPEVLSQKAEDEE